MEEGNWPYQLLYTTSQLKEVNNMLTNAKKIEYFFMKFSYILSQILNSSEISHKMIK